MLKIKAFAYALLLFESVLAARIIALDVNTFNNSALATCNEKCGTDLSVVITDSNGDDANLLQIITLSSEDRGFPDGYDEYLDCMRNCTGLTGVLDGISGLTDFSKLMLSSYASSENYLRILGSDIHGDISDISD